jgi:MFS family permease
MTRTTAPLHHRDFTLLWSGQTVSMVGDGIFTVALALETLRVDHHAAGLSYVLAARLLPSVLLLLVGGVVVDRVPRRLAMLASDGVRAVTVAVVTFLVASGRIDLTYLIVMSVVFGIADAFFFPASTAIVPELVPPDLLVGASALNSTSTQLAQVLVGPALGGVIAGALGTAWAFGIDAGSFVVSATCLLCMTARPRPAPSGGSVFKDVADGFRYCRSQRWLWVTLIAAGLANFACYSPLGVLIPLLIERTLHKGGVALGLVFAAGGLGGTLTSVVVGRLGAPRRRVTFMWLGWGLTGFAVIGLGVAPDVWLAGIAAFVGFGLSAYGNVLWNPLMQELVPADMIGRASSIDYLVSICLSPLGLVAAGATASLVGIRVTLIVGGVIGAASGLALFVPGVRDPDRGRLP